MSEPKKIKREDLENLLASIENEGFEYCFTHLSDWEEFKDTELEPFIKAYKDAHDVLDLKIEQLAKDEGIEL